MPQNSSGLTLRSIIIAIGLSLFLLTSSSYIAIKLGALPWPIIFSVIVSGGIIKLLNRGRAVNIHEINVAQAGASIGGLVAAGVVFTLPGILYLNQTRGLEIPWPKLWVTGLVVCLAALLGVLLSVPLKYTFIDEENLPYPSGTAGAELLKLGKTGGRLLLSILMIGALAAIFTLVRDNFFPAGFLISPLTAFGIYLVFLPMPLALSSGFILGEVASFSWFAGAALGWLIIIPWLFQRGYTFESARAFAQNLGMGVVLGSGIGFFFSYIIPRMKRIFAPMLHSGKKLKPLAFFLILAGWAGLIITGVPVPAALITIFSVWIMVTVAARMTGETNINPLEQFGIFVGLVISLIYTIFSLELNMFASFLIVLFVSVACAVAGDAGHDYKSAAIVGTEFLDVVKVDLIAALVAGIAAPFVLETIKTGFADTLFTAVMPAPQAQLVAGSIFGFEFPRVFLTGFVLAFLAEMVFTFLLTRWRTKIMFMAMGIGLFLGMGLAIPIALGAVIYLWVKRRFHDFYHMGLLIAAGIMGGEGIAGFVSGALKAFGLNANLGSLILAIVFCLIFFTSGVFYWKEINKK